MCKIINLIYFLKFDFFGIILILKYQIKKDILKNN